MWVYYQKTGNLLRDGLFVATGYSGNGSYKNNPDTEMIKDHGPLPRGLYVMTHVDDEKGPNTIHLEPSKYNEMYERSGFLIHGDSIDHPGEASDGCIVIGPAARAELIDDMGVSGFIAVV